MRKFSQQQYDYIVAQAALDTCRGRIKNDMAQQGFVFHDGMSPAEIEAYSEAESALYVKYRYSQVLTILYKCEKELIIWTGKTLKKLEPTEYNKIAPAFDKLIFNPIIRDKLINTCMQFNPY